MIAENVPVAPLGLNHLVVNVRDIAESHRFWTEIIGLKHVADFALQREGRGPMRFYSGQGENGQRHHHDLALVEVAAMPFVDTVSAIGHIAFTLANREAWWRHIAHLRTKKIPLERVEHGMSHSVYVRDPNGYKVELLYELPREQWEHNIAAALNHYVPRDNDEAAAPEL